MVTRGVMQNYFEIGIWKSLRNAIANGFEEFIFEGDLLEVAIDLADHDADVQKYLDSGKFDLNSIMNTVESFRRYHEKVR